MTSACGRAPVGAERESRFSLPLSGAVLWASAGRPCSDLSLTRSPSPADTSSADRARQRPHSSSPLSLSPAQRPGYNRQRELFGTFTLAEKILLRPRRLLQLKDERSGCSLRFVSEIWLISPQVRLEGNPGWSSADTRETIDTLQI